MGRANGSGWMQDEDFVAFLHNFAKNVKCHLSQPVMILMDNHSSHLNVGGIDFCKNNGVVLLSSPRTAPTNYSHSIGVCAFKNLYNLAADCWMRNNPGKVMSIYDIPGLVKEVFPLSVNQLHILAGFRACGIVPLILNIFTDVDFAPSALTDRPDPSGSNASPLATTSARSAASLLSSFPSSARIATAPQTQTGDRTATSPRSPSPARHAALPEASSVDRSDASPLSLLIFRYITTSNVSSAKQNNATYLVRPK